MADEDNVQANLLDYDSTTSNGNWHKLSGKLDGGVNESGVLAGQYKVKVSETETKKVYLKQDQQQSKNIAEVFASQFMRFILSETGENPDLVANVDFVKTDQGVYVASEMFEGYHDLYKDAGLAMHLPAYSALRDNDLYSLRAKRPEYLEAAPDIDIIISAGRYKQFVNGLAVRAIVDDPDTHYGNIGVVAIQKADPRDLIPVFEMGEFTGKALKAELSDDDIIGETVVINEKIYYQYNTDSYDFMDKEFCIKYEGKYYIIPGPGNARAVNIDFGGALGDNRLFPRKLDGQIHIIDKFKDFFRYLPSLSGPPAYQHQHPDHIKNDRELFIILAKYSAINETRIIEKIDEIMTLITKNYKDQPAILKEFALRIGAPFNEQDNSLQRVQKIAEFLKTCFIAKQKHAKEVLLNYFERANLDSQKSLLEESFHDSQRAKMLAACFTKNDTEKQKLHDLYKRIDRLDEKMDVTEKEYASQLKRSLFQLLIKGIIKNNLENVFIDVEKKIEHTQDLIEHFNFAKQQMDAAGTENNKTKAYNDFVKEISNYEKNCINNSKSRHFLVAASTFAGALLGIIIGGALGLTIGGLVGFAVGSPLPILGNVAAAVTIGSTVGVATAIKGAGIGAAIGVAVGTFLIGPAIGYAANKSMGYLIFSQTESASKKFAKQLNKDANQLKKEPIRMDYTAAFDEREQDEFLIVDPVVAAV